MADRGSDRVFTFSRVHQGVVGSKVARDLKEGVAWMIKRRK